VYREAEFGLNYTPRIEFILLGAAALIFGVLWLYRREEQLQSRTRRYILAALRVTGLVLLAVAILGPVLKVHKKEKNDAVVAVAIDVSKSMSLPCGKQGTRFTRAREVLAGPNGILSQLSATSEVRVFAFGNTTRQVKADELGSVNPEDDGTNISEALKDITQTTRGVPLAATIVLSDGVDTTAGDVEAMARYVASKGTTVHTIGFGDVSNAPDVGIFSVTYPRKASLHALVDVNVMIQRGNYAGPLDLDLYQDVNFIKAVPVPPSINGEPVLVTVKLLPEKAGTQGYRLELPKVAGEVNLENNKRTFQIQVDETRVEILLVEGSPRHEYAYIRREMRNDKDFAVISLVRLGKGHYYQSADDNSMLTQGFPETAEQLGRFKAIILSDIEASYFTSRQLELISDFVKVRGGGLLMLGGVNSFNLGGYQDTPVAPLLPVSLNAEHVASYFDDSEYSFQVTKEGAGHEILRLAADPAANISQWALMPALRGLNPLFKAKPGARVLAGDSRPGPNGSNAVLLAVQDVGAGRTAIFAPANSWRWRMLRPLDDDSYRRFWSQMIRWLAVGSKEMLSIATDHDVVNVRQPLSINAQVLDKTHHPCNDATVVAQIKDPFGNVSEVSLPWVLSEDGVYQALYRPADKGEYSVSIVANVAGTNLEKSTTFSAVESSVEFLHPSLDAATIERVAKAGGGTSDITGNSEKAVAAILKQLSENQKLLDLIEERELRDAPILMLAILGVWIAEWFLRRRSGLA
jgi:uncharacterized membrane protein